MLKQPATKYRAFEPVRLADRRWPDKVITEAPIWLSTDLRDGNQALFEPMSGAAKLKLFKTLVAVGFKEIEVAFPSASQTDFDFVRTLIEGDHIPDDVTIGVLTQAREHLIRRTFESLAGARRAIVHFYNATAPNFRRIVFNTDREGTKAIAVESAQLVQQLAAERPETDWTFQYSPEVFSGTELEFAKEIVDAVTAVWAPTPAKRVIINLPATVEGATPNVYADQIEWMHRKLARRDGIILSVHPHNDRGCAVAAAELAVMAGADRIEGCLFGNGERTGNVDLVTLALNLYTQGVDPKLDFSDINAVARVAEEVTQLPIHPRHPYVGDLVFTAFSGSHQDAIKKGLAVQDPNAIWEVPYLPVDPKDLGRSYESVIRVNSQSGKGGIAYLLEEHYGVAMPRRMQVEFAAEVQRHLDDVGREVSAQELWRIFCETYLERGAPAYVEHHLFEAGEQQGIRITTRDVAGEQVREGRGNGPLDAAVHALGLPVRVVSFEERSLSAGSDARAVAFVEIVMDGVAGSAFGAGLHGNVTTAAILALVSAVARARQRLSTFDQPVPAPV
ncbi:2-isopropylmalate synthase [Niveibacterium umoris]|uniref:2-isopropylmalate synthase n=1 Tax=Niveibacterium umoris TaxID=1193620 RepID=A0A840BLE3_9RHOO|nr:2-isopropylmalate synthase [Niveibacterium umoris]MBB4014065.1 2-isopropylmalate synthase [Niveibacterium umoris]